NRPTKSRDRPPTCGVRIARGLVVASPSHGLNGVCDVVEIWDDGRLIPIEYKRGRPKAHRADEVQLCGQAICLEATLSRPPGSIASGFLYYGQKRRRTEVHFDAELRALTLAVAEQVRVMIEEGSTPSAEYEPRRCDRCSLLDLCQPRALRFHRGAAAWFKRSMETVLSP
ncbi:MAG: CRISPR-associated protein Cas4, partial [Opitutales bacterium]